MANLIKMTEIKSVCPFLFVKLTMIISFSETLCHKKIPPALIGRQNLHKNTRFGFWVLKLFKFD